MQSPQDILLPGTPLKLHHFGFAYVRRLYIHPKEKELACDVFTNGGQNLHLSLKYAVSVIYEGRPMFTTTRQPDQSRLAAGLNPPTQAIDATITSCSGFAGRAGGGVSC